MPVQFSSGDVDGDPDGIRGHGGDRAHGGQELDQGGVRGEPPRGSDREESHFQGKDFQFGFDFRMSQCLCYISRILVSFSSHVDFKVFLSCCQ